MFKSIYVDAKNYEVVNTTLEQARRGATIIGETLANKKLKSNLTPSRYVLLGSEEFKAKTRKEAKEAPVMMGSHIMEQSPDEKYLLARMLIGRELALPLILLERCLGCNNCLHWTWDCTL